MPMIVQQLCYHSNRIVLHTYINIEIKLIFKLTVSSSIRTVTKRWFKVTNNDKYDNERG